jgi:hypothetical protein
MDSVSPLPQEIDENAKPIEPRNDTA